MKKLTDKYGRKYIQTKAGKVYDSINPKDLIDGFHNYSNKQNR